MVRYYIARHKGESDAYYQRKKVYPIAFKKSFFSKKVQVYKRRGYYDEMEPDTHRTYPDIAAFESVWRIIKED